MIDRKEATPPALRSERVIAAFKHLFGTSQRKAMGLVFVLLLTLSWFSTASYDLFILLFDCQRQSAGELVRLLIGLLLFPAIAWFLLRKANEAAQRVPVAIHQDDNPVRVPALVMFLSPPGQAVEYLTRVAKGEVEAKLGDPVFRDSVQFSWRMPVEAIAYHRDKGTLRAIVLIPSADTRSGKNRRDGTHADVGLFRELVTRLTDGKVAVYTLPNREKGVDYEQAQELTDAVEEAYALLAAKGFQADEVLVDITGGKKVPTIAGAAVALSEDRQFQYVSTHDYRVRTYDITYLS